MDKINVFIYRDKADGRINDIHIITYEQLVKNYAQDEPEVENYVTKEMVIADMQRHNADRRNNSIVEWTDCRTLLDAENLLRKIRTLGDAALGEAPKQQTTSKAGRNDRPFRMFGNRSGKSMNDVNRLLICVCKIKSNENNGNSRGNKIS